MKETWKPVSGYEEFYSVSSLGRIKRIKEGKNTFIGKVLKPFLCKGYLHVNLTDGCSIKKDAIHRIAAKAFIDNPLSKPEVNHKDGNKINNDIANLEWVTDSENTLHSYRLGLQVCNRERDEQGKFI